MDLADTARIVLRWVHAVAAVAWVGGSIFYLTVLEPAIKGVEGLSPRGALEMSLGRAFRELVEICIVALSVTGVLLTFDRLSQGGVSAVYIVILAAKVMAAAGMFFIARELSRKGMWMGSPGPPTAQADSPRGKLGLLRGVWGGLRVPSRLLLLLGLLIFLLAIALRAVFESGLKAAQG